VDILDWKTVWGGAIYYDRAGNGCYKWSIQSKKEIEKLQNYFKVYPLFTTKMVRSHLISTFLK
jgi:hypothetical protein